MNPIETEKDIRALEATGVKFHGNPPEPLKSRNTPRQQQRRVSPLATMLMIAAVLGSVPLEAERPMRKCLLPGCDKLTKHNGGYCCAEHHEQHKRANEKS